MINHMEATLRQIKKILNFTLSRLAGALLIVMTILVLYQVFTRYVLSNPADFTEELVRYILIWTGFIGAAYAFSSRQHMALLFIRDKFGSQQKRILMVLTDCLILVFALFVIIIGGTKLALSAQQELSALLGISRGLVYAVAPLAGIFIVIAQLINIWEDITGIMLDNGEHSLAGASTMPVDSRSADRSKP